MPYPEEEILHIDIRKIEIFLNQNYFPKYFLKSCKKSTGFDTIILN